GPPAPAGLRRAAGPANAETCARRPPASPPPLLGSTHPSRADRAMSRTASDVSLRELVPGPFPPPSWSSSKTGHFTSYIIRSHHELATIPPSAGSPGAVGGLGLSTLR